MMGHSEHDPDSKDRRPWNAGRKLGAKRALKPQQVWATRFWLDRERRVRDRALFDLAIDSKLRGCDLVKLRIGDLVSGGRVRSRAIVVQRKTRRPCSSSCSNRPAPGSWGGSTAQAARSTTTCFRAASTMRPTSARGSTRGSSTNG